MNVPVLFGIVIIFIIWLRYEIRKTKKQSKKYKEDFWQIENEANLTRRVDISNLNYISIPINCLPIADQDDATLNSYRDTILILSEKDILNLTGITNTQLKLQYGASNINKLSECDNNYTALVSTLHKWGERLYNLGFVTDAVSVLEFAVICFTDVSKTYHLLARIYKEQKSPDKIDDLAVILTETKMLRKDVVIQELEQIKNS